MAIRLSFEGGEVTLHPNQVEANCFIASAVKNDPEGWSKFQGTITVRNWIPLLETAYHLLHQTWKNPEFIKKYVEVDDETAQKLAEGKTEGISQDVLQRYEPLRMCRIRDGRRSIEIYKPAKEVPAALMLTDGENKKRSRILLNDLALRAFIKGILRILNGSVALKGSNPDEFAIFQRRNDRINVTTSSGYSKTLSFYERCLLEGSLSNFPKTWGVRPFAFKDMKTFNREGQAYLNIEGTQIPLDKNAIKLLLLLR